MPTLNEMFQVEVNHNEKQVNGDMVVAMTMAMALTIVYVK